MENVASFALGETKSPALNHFSFASRFVIGSALGIYQLMSTRYFFYSASAIGMGIPILQTGLFAYSYKNHDGGALYELAAPVLFGAAVVGALGCMKEAFHSARYLEQYFIQEGLSPLYVGLGLQGSLEQLNRIKQLYAIFGWKGTLTVGSFFMNGIAAVIHFTSDSRQTRKQLAGI